MEPVMENEMDVEKKLAQVMHYARRGSNSVAPANVPQDRPIVYAEIGTHMGHTAFLVANKLAAGSTMHLFDFGDTLEHPKRLPYEGLAKQKSVKIVKHPTEREYDYDSYNWPLMWLLEKHPEPIFDYVFLDGAHMWFQEALAFTLCDRLLKPGGKFEFDDYKWVAANSLSVRGHEKWLSRYTPEQMQTPNVTKVVNLLVKRDPRYKPLVANRLYKKVEA